MRRILRDDHRYAKWHLKRRKQFQAFVSYFKPSMIAIGTITTEHIDLELPLERLEILHLRPHDLPERFNVALQRLGFGHNL